MTKTSVFWFFFSSEWFGERKCTYYEGSTIFHSDKTSFSLLKITDFRISFFKKKDFLRNFLKDLAEYHQATES